MKERKRISIVDATLREGCQVHNVFFECDHSKTIASHLYGIGVDMIEVGHPVISEYEMNRVKQVVALDFTIPVLSHARACADDIKAVADSGAHWVGIFLGVNAITTTARLPGRNFGSLIDHISQSIDYAKTLGLKVRYTLEDASRTSEEATDAAFQAAVNSGADRICFADTVGVMEPQSVSSVFARLRSRFPDLDIEAHFHNDRGLAISNALAAISSGANWISTSVNGLGERCGSVDLAILFANLQYKKILNNLPWNSIREISEIVSKLAQLPVDKMKPVIGEYAFLHSADLHKKAIQRDENAYTWVSPEKLGLEKPM